MLKRVLSPSSVMEESGGLLPPNAQRSEQTIRLSPYCTLEGLIVLI